jgi:hypothetical protein
VHALVASTARIRGIAEPPRSRIGVPVSSTASGIAPSWIAAATGVIGASGTAAPGGSGVATGGGGCGSPQLSSNATETGIETRNRGRNVIAIRAGTLSRTQNSKHELRGIYLGTIIRSTTSYHTAVVVAGSRLDRVVSRHICNAVLQSSRANVTLHGRCRSAIAIRIRDTRFATISSLFRCNVEHQIMATAVEHVGIALTPALLT